MDKKATSVSNEIGNLAEDAQALLSATANATEEKIVEARKRLTVALEKGQEIWGLVQDKACETAKAADQTVRKHPYQAMGVAFGVGAVLGYILTRRNN